MKKTFLLLMISSSFYGFAQTEKLTDQRPYIEVTGTAIQEVVPDKIFISITLSDKVVDNEKYTIQSQEDKLKIALTKINIDLNNLVLTDATSEITTYKKKETGFKVLKEYTLQVKNAEEISKVYKELYAINIRESYIAKTEHSQIDSLRKVVRIAAVKAAKDKAEYLLAAIGEKIDKPLEVREQQQPSYYNASALANTTVFNANVRSDNDDDKKVETTFQKFTIQFSYYIKYSIK
jgi:uncharacterized protein YggE